MRTTMVVLALSLASPGAAQEPPPLPSDTIPTFVLAWDHNVEWESPDPFQAPSHFKLILQQKPDGKNTWPDGELLPGAAKLPEQPEWRATVPKEYLAPYSTYAAAIRACANETVTETDETGQVIRTYTIEHCSGFSNWVELVTGLVQLFRPPTGLVIR